LSACFCSLASKRRWEGASCLGSAYSYVRVKDRPQEVKEILLLSRKCQSASERHLCPQAIHKEKSYKTHPHPDLWDHPFPGPLAFPNMQSFSSLRYK
jgi:hypothetical protein